MMLAESGNINQQKITGETKIWYYFYTSCCSLSGQTNLLEVFLGRATEMQECAKSKLGLSH